MGAKLARRAGVPLLPLALKTDFMGIGKVIRDCGRLDRSRQLHFKFGQPMQIEGNGKEQHEATVNFIGDNLRAWGHSAVSQ